MVRTQLQAPANKKSLQLGGFCEGVSTLLGSRPCRAPSRSFSLLTNAGWHLIPTRPNTTQPCRPTVAPAASTRLRPICCRLGALTSHPQCHPVRSQSLHHARGHLSCTPVGRLRLFIRLRNIRMMRFLVRPPSFAVNRTLGRDLGSTADKSVAMLLLCF